MEFYRYTLQASDVYGQDYDGEYVRTGFRDVKVVENIYSLVKETPKGYWIDGPIIGQAGSYTLSIWDGGKRWIPKQSRKRFAYPTRKEAMKSFIRRQEERIRILSIQIGDSKIGLFNAKSKLKDL